MRRGRHAIFLADSQMDWIDGPISGPGLEPGPGGSAAALFYELMEHLTRPEFVYRHSWQQADLLVVDNRSCSHVATHFDTSAAVRSMWRVTVCGNPGAFYAGRPAKPAGACQMGLLMDRFSKIWHQIVRSDRQARL